MEENLQMGLGGLPRRPIFKYVSEARPGPVRREICPITLSLVSWCEPQFSYITPNLVKTPDGGRVLSK